MVKKRTIKEIASFLQSTGETLISDEYINNKTKLDILCANNHNYKMSFDHKQRGHGCPICSGNKKHTIEEVRKIFELNGERLLTCDYKNSHGMLKAVCQAGHEYAISFSSKQQGHGCRSCYVDSRKHKYRYTKSIVELNGDRLLTQNYVNSGTKLDILCVNGHTYQMSFNGKRAGYGCRQCTSRAKFEFVYVKETIESGGETLVSDKYENIDAKLTIKCREGHLYKMSLGSKKAGQNCPACAKYGFNPLNPAYFYYVKFITRNGIFYKIGVTGMSVEKRFARSSAMVKILYQQYYESGQEAYEREQYLLKKFSQNRMSVKDFSLIDFLGKCGGHTECFRFDVLGLDKETSCTQQSVQQIEPQSLQAV